jgi:site-specific DNA recombinase
MHVALYARVSTTRQAENDLSIPDQLRQLNEWAKANGHLVVREYVEPGASATDDKRPVFQQMMADALMKPPAFDSIIIHSLSRFFRDMIEFGLNERKLAKNKVSVISITQPTSDDAGGEMMRRIINLFDEHQSKENSKHTSRAMRENARQGFFNGSVAPFGYQALATDISGSRGRKRKKLVVNDAEAGIVRMIYGMYLHGKDGQDMGCKEIAKYLTGKGLLMRGKPWRMQKIQTILSDPLYMGEFFTNIRDSKANVNRPPEEWIKVIVPSIIDAATFEQVRARRESRAPTKTPPRLTNSPTLLTGLLKCGCGASMTLATGKGGNYKYYKCTRRQSQGNHACTSANLPMKKTDALVLEQLTEKVFGKDHLQILMSELAKRIKSSKDDQQKRINAINQQIKQIEDRQRRLLDAIETGIIELDELTQRRAQGHKAAREALFVELASVRRDTALPAVKYLKPGQVEQFGKVLREKVLVPDSPLAKRYLGILIDEILVQDKTATIRGSHAALADAMQLTNSNALSEVPSFNPDWRARRDSNFQPSDPWWWRHG